MTKRLLALSSFWTALALLGACGGPAEELDTESTVAAFSEAACSNAMPDQLLKNMKPGTTVVGYTPTTYSNPSCGKAYLFDLGMLPATAALLSPYDIIVQWADPWPRTQAQCATTLSMEVYATDYSIPGGSTYVYGPITAPSEWKDGACQLGSIYLSSSESPFGPSAPRVGFLSVNDQFTSIGVPYFGNDAVRLSVTARTAANNTQPVKVSYTVNPDIPFPPPEIPAEESP